MKFITVINVPDELGHAWLQHMRDFDIAHPGCEFMTLAHGPDMSTEEMRALLNQVAPTFAFKWEKPC